MAKIAAMHNYQLPAGWETAITEWQGWLRLTGMAPSSIHLRKSHVRSVARRTGAPNPAALSTDDVIRLFSAHDWSRDHRKAMRTSLRMFCDWAVEQQLMGHNPGDALPRVKTPPVKARPVTEHQWHDLLDNAAPRELLMARLAGEAGLRRAEVARTHTRDLIREPAGWSLIVTGKGDKQRVVPITDQLADSILAYTRNGYLFPGQERGHISAKHCGTLISRLLGPDGTMHQLRHRFASRGYQETKDLRAVQRLLGHYSIATTERYVASTDADARRIVEAVAKAS